MEDIAAPDVEIIGGGRNLLRRKTEDAEGLAGERAVGGGGASDGVPGGLHGIIRDGKMDSGGTGGGTRGCHLLRIAPVARLPDGLTVMGEAADAERRKDADDSDDNQDLDEGEIVTEAVRRLEAEEAMGWLNLEPLTTDEAAQIYAHDAE